jgi:uncharacterized protein (DUF2126 family)
VLPLDHRDGKWRTDAWVRITRNELYLLPGKGPVGLRLPLSELPPSAVHCALSVEQSKGDLTVFLPPCPTFEAFTELVQEVEGVAVELQVSSLKVIGYPPPADPNLDTLTLTPDPGVLEVNLPPAERWEELDHLVHAVFAAADACGLRGYKLQPRGRVIPTGGGSHILFGGPGLDQNPFANRPWLVSSLVRFVQNHPSLSYVFSGLFTGPSCQSPRVDESAKEVPYELEIALRSLEARKSCAPDQLDSLLRNLLLDWNGNTHRAEISVDKFYNRNAANGRMGVVECRAFEMMPTPELLLAPSKRTCSCQAAPPPRVSLSGSLAALR